MGRVNDQTVRRNDHYLVNEASARTTLWRYASGKQSNEHPAVFPIALAKDHILRRGQTPATWC